MQIRIRNVYGLLGCALLFPMMAGAQEPTPRDSLEREVRELRARLDSLEKLIEELSRRGSDTSAMSDELAALRRAAREAAGDESPGSQGEDPSASGGNLNRLNPEISVTGDMRFQGFRPGPQEDNVDIREFEFSFQSALDPFASTKIFFSFGEDEVGVEEAYAYWTGLPGGIRADIGRIRQQVGELNRWHLHALPESEYPLVLTEYFGEEGLIGDGLNLYWIAPFNSPGGGTHEIWGQVTLANNEVLFDEGGRLSYLGHVNNFWQLNRSTFLQLGGTALYGENPDVDLESTVFGGDVRVTWRPPEQALYRSFTLRGEGYAARREIGGVGETVFGGYLGGEYQLTRRLFIGGRLDYVEPFDDPNEHIWALVPRFKWWQSEWVYLTAEWQRLSVPTPTGRESSDRFLIQVVWAVGPHKHETY